VPLEDALGNMKVIDAIFRAAKSASGKDRSVSRSRPRTAIIYWLPTTTVHFLTRHFFTSPLRT
jgi:hypothetical protein